MADVLNRAPTIPHRKVLREWLAPLRAPSTSRALAMVALDLLLLVSMMALAILARTVSVKLIAASATGVVIARLFILGHDACHQSFTRHRRLNRWLGRVLFLPSLTPYSLWEVGHNVVHHGYTNLSDFDFVWQPMTLARYRALPRWRRALERIYRSGWAPGAYYLVEIWWRRMIFPSRETMPTQRAVFLLDGLLVSAFAIAWIGGLVMAAVATGQSVPGLIAYAFAIPFLTWNSLMGFVLYVHHTHESIGWYADKRAWSASQPFVSTTVHLSFKGPVGGLLHHIMEHTAHHVDMSLPLYRLKRAQALLEVSLPGHLVVQRFSWRWYRHTARHCKLWDFEDAAWTDYKGRPSAAASD